jgi:hypothetical protein
MPARQAYEDKVTIVIAELFPQMSEAGRQSLVWLLIDFLMSLDGICASMPDPDP